MSWTETTHEIKKTFYTWTIDNYEFLQDVDVDHGLTSPTFPNDGSGLEFYLHLNVQSEKATTDVELCATDESTRHKGMVKFVLFGRTTKDYMVKLPKPRKRSSVSLQNTCLRDFAASQYGKLIIECKIEYLGQRIDKSGTHDNSIKVASCKLAEDLGAMLNTKELADFAIVTGDGQKIPVHKNILSARSKVFAAMFKHRMQENAENCVEIKDFSFDVVSELIWFMYTGEAPNLNLEMSAELLAAADKYGLDRLKSMCAKLMSDNLSVENAHVVAKSANLYNLPDLKIKAIQFIQTNIQKETGGSKYGDFLKELMEQKLQELKLNDSAIDQKND